MDTLFERQDALLRATSMSIVRSFMEQVNWSAPMLCIRGPRGVGKSTLLRQYINLHYKTGSEDVLYCSMDWVYFSQRTMLEVAESFYKHGGRLLVIDEVHKCENWSREVKEVAETYPQLQLMLSGSSLLKLLDGDVDLSRRCRSYDMPGLSFREYLRFYKGIELPAHPLEEMLESPKEVAAEVNKVCRPLQFFHDYLRYGYYPFYLTNPIDYYALIEQTVNYAVDVELPQQRKVNPANCRRIKALLNALAQLVPYDVDISKLSSFFAVLALFASINAFAEGVEIDDIYYYFNGDEAEVTSVNKGYGSVVILSSITYNGKTYSVTSIASDSFKEKTRITDITIPESVTYIAYSALDRTGWYLNQPGGLVYAGKVAYKYKGIMPSGTHIDIEEGTLSISPYAFSDPNANAVSPRSPDCSGLTSITIPNSVKFIGYAAFANCSNLTSITFPDNAMRIGRLAFSNTPWYINQPDGLVYAGKIAYRYKGTLALTEEEVSMQQAYTLMDANAFTYSVYDPVNNCIGTLSVNGIDENNPNHSWQVIEAAGNRYLYNMGAKKFAVASANGSYSLSDAPTPINMADGDNGIILGTQTAKQWVLVRNESMSVEQAIIDGISLTPALPEGEEEWYSPDGMKLAEPQKGINIIRYADVSTRKVVLK